MNAGCIFTDRKYILGGYQQNKQRPCISGFGGKAKEGERPYETAWRETLEELFGWDEVPKGLLQRTMIYEEGVESIKSEDDTYIGYIYSFWILDKLLKEAKGSGYTSEYYDEFPETLQELIFNRSSEGEIGDLCILPRKAFMNKEVFAEEFVEDIKNLEKSRTMTK